MDVLVKTKWTKPQTTLSRKARLKNIAGSIKIENISKIKGKKVILVDDVVTTATTVDLCSRLLKKAGAKEVVVLSIAVT
jgi:predicted amidophosphoribosyltransferase